MEKVRTLLTDLNSSWRQVAHQVKTLLDAGTGVPTQSVKPAGLPAYPQADAPPRLALKA